MSNNKKIVLTYGTFDLFHIGHLNLLRRAKSLGDILYVGVSTDEFCSQRGKTVTIPFEDRKSIVESIKYVDGVFTETCPQQKLDDFKRFGADILVMGDDWKGHYGDVAAAGYEVVFLPRTENISTTEIKKKIHDYR